MFMDISYPSGTVSPSNCVML